MQFLNQSLPAMSTGNIAEAKPYGKRCKSVVKNVKKSDLIFLFTQDKEQRIKEVNQLWDVKAIAH